MPVLMRYGAAISITCGAMLYACTTSPPLDQLPLNELVVRYDKLKPPDCLKLFEPYCAANGYQSCPETVPSDRIYGEQLMSWESCGGAGYIRTLTELRKALNVVFARSLATVPPCVLEVIVPANVIKEHHVDPEAPDASAQLVVWGILVQPKSRSCVEELCRWQMDHLKQYTENDHYCLKLRYMPKGAS